MATMGVDVYVLLTTGAVGMTTGDVESLYSCLGKPDSLYIFDGSRRPDDVGG